ncbi:hypothetical protein [Nocardioides sp.]|uniref:hypothetical protein n=1 Tax=Nocardioides sp. TaxID=35761 RepID=UPI00262FFB2B|nr:hypothetical protein [Nocardioides sp.]MCW2736433.1 hypothetical protein [Nocardioides sp.]
MSRITGVVVALATTAAVLSGSTVGAAPPGPPPESPATGLPREIPGGVELTLADGDLLRVWAADNHRAVWSTRRDASTGTWGARQEVLRRKNLFCGDVDARTASGAVAVLAQCDRYSYAEDQAPTSSRALWSADAVSWSSYRLVGEAYEEPGISPDGTNAVWPLHEGYATRTDAGFAAHRVDSEGQEYTLTATITDAEQVSFVYGDQTGRRCALVVLTRTGDGAPARQELPLAEGCSDTSLVNTDVDTVLVGDLSDPAYRTVVSRPDSASPWAVTEVAPASAPGLVWTDGRLATDFIDTQDLPLVALGGTRGGTVRAQLYDRATQSWGPSIPVHDTGRTPCRWSDNRVARPLAVLVAGLTCSGGRQVVLTSTDATSWQALRAGHHTFGLSPDGRYVAVPGRSQTSVVSAERGVVTLPLPVTGRCDVVVPDGPDGAVLLTSAGRHRGWPTVLRHSSPGRWTTLSRTRLPVFEPECRTVRSSNDELPFRFDLYSRSKGYTVRIVQRDGEWTVRRSRY